MTTSRKGAVRSGLLDASRHGSEVTLLRRLRNRLAEMLDDPQLSPRDFGTLSRRLLDVTEVLRVAEIRGDRPIPAELIPDAPLNPWDL